MISQILKVAINYPFSYCLDYLPPEGIDPAILLPGMRLQVPLKKRIVVGVLVNKTQNTLIQTPLKQAIRCLDTKPIISTQLLKLLEWASKYYHYPIGQALFVALPGLLRKPKTFLQKEHNINPPLEEPLLLDPNFDLHPAQVKAIQAVEDALGSFQVFLLEGVTGSGKTEVYLQLIAKVIKQGKQALLLVPEIGLTPQTVSRLQNRFPVPIAVLHSHLTEKARLEAWLLAHSAPIVMGTRSALFAPLSRLGLVILDEEHDISFKQQEGLRYSARDLAIMRAHLERVPVVLGSATPSLESYYNVKTGRYKSLILPERAGNALLPLWRIIDIRGQNLHHGISVYLLEAIKKHLDQGKQALLFLNRRGFAPALFCHQCGWIARCSYCDANLTLHHTPYQLNCHYCNYTQAVMSMCVNCQHTPLWPVGQGTEQLESALSQYFSHFPCIRMDSDSIRRKGTLQDLLSKVQSGEPQIILGTQLLSKGHHFPNVTLVGIIDIDSNLYSSDFRAIERAAQTLMQVAGRAGRAQEQGIVCVQTHNAQHKIFEVLGSGKPYSDFANLLLEERKSAQLPPYSYLALMRAASKKPKKAYAFLEKIKNAPLSYPKIEILGPVASPMEKKAGYYYVQLLFKSKSRNILQQYLLELRTYIEQLKVTLRWSLDIDPMDLY